MGKKGKAKPIVAHGGAALGLKKGGKIVSKWVSSPIPSEIADALTDPCGVTYYTDRVNEAREYRPFYRSKLNDLQTRVILARGKAGDIREAMDSAYDEMRAEIGVNKEEADRVVEAIQSGDTYDSDLRKAHWFIYGDHPAALEYLIEVIGGELRSDLRTLLSTYLSTSAALNGVLKEIDTIHAVATEALNCSENVVDQLTSWEGNALNTAMGFCQETDGMGYLTNRVQLFRPRESNQGSSAVTFSGYRNAGWSAWNDPCDTFRKEVDGGYSYQRWPRIGDSNYERPLARALGYPSSAWGWGCRKDYFGVYDCGKVSGPQIRSCLDYLTSTLPTTANRFLDDRTGYTAALFDTSERLMRQAKGVILDILTLLRGLRDTLSSPGMNTAIDVAEIACEFGTLLIADCSFIEDARDGAVRGIQGAIRDLKSARDDLTSGISGHPTAKTMWEDPSTEWRITAEMAVNGLQSLNGPIHTPWTNDLALGTCRRVFPEIPNDCLDNMIPELCSATGGLVAHEELPFDPGDAEGGWKGKGSPGGPGGGIPTVLTDLGAISPSSSKRVMGLLPWQALALIAGVWMLWPEKK